jgi:hypothetical protein
MTDRLDDLRRAFDRVEVPELWPEIQRRAALDVDVVVPFERRRALRVPAIAAAAIVAVVALVAVVAWPDDGDTPLAVTGTDEAWIAVNVPIAGWHMERPGDWHEQVFEDHCMVGESGAVITNLERDLEPETPAASGGRFECSTGWELPAAADFVGVEVSYRAGGPATSPDDATPDTSRPLGLDAFQRVDARTRYLPVTIGGESRYGVRVWIGADASAADIATVERMVASIRWVSSPTATSTTTMAPSVSLDDVDWSKVRYPIDCGETNLGQVGWRVVDFVRIAPGVGTDLAIALVTCDAGAGSPPANLYVYDRAESATNPHLAQTLVRPDDNWVADDHVDVIGGDLSLGVSGYSSEDLPRCCPDVFATLTWQWDGDEYQPTSTPPEHFHY